MNVGANVGPHRTLAAVSAIRVVLALALIASFVYMVVKSWHWPILSDAGVLRYANFLMDHGFAPYRDVLDVNMPGSYFSDRLAVFLFGPSDFGWRMYDFFLMIAATVGMIAIAWPYDWLAGLFSGVLFALLHAADGPTVTGERDQFIAVLMILGYAFLFYAVRRARPQWMAGLGFVLGMAATVKPTNAPLGFILLGMAAMVLHRRHVRIAPYILYSLLGAAGASAIFFGFLLRQHSLMNFINIARDVTTQYAGLGRLSRLTLLREGVPRSMRLLFPIGIVLTVMNRKQWNWERWALIVGTVIGVLSYFLQGKGFYPHRYELMACTLLWFSIEFAIAARKAGAPRFLALTGVLVGMVVTIPNCLIPVRDAIYLPLYNATTEAVTDLQQLGPDRLQGKVQCLDMTGGCFYALYRLGLVQYSGSMGDALYFSSDNSSPPVQHFRKLLWDSLQADPPDVFVMNNELFFSDPSFDKVKRWPQFAQYLADHYDIYSEHWLDEKAAFRVYVRKGSFAELSTPPAHP